MRWMPRRRLVAAHDHPAPSWLPPAVFLVCVFATIFSLVRAEAWRSLLAWTDYNSYVHARLRLFDELTFFEFVNVYTLLPLSAGYLILSDRRRRVTAGAVVVVLALQYPLAQRKVLLVSVLLIASAIYLYRHAGWAPRSAVRSRHQIRWLAGGPAVIYVAYVGLTLITVLGPGSGAFRNLTPDADRERRAHLKIPRLGDDASVSFRLDEEAIQRIQSNRALSVTLYVLLSPLTRTSVAAVTYPVVFPRVQPVLPAGCRTGHSRIWQHARRQPAHLQRALGPNTGSVRLGRRFPSRCIRRGGCGWRSSARCWSGWGLRSHGGTSRGSRGRRYCVVLYAR